MEIIEMCFKAEEQLTLMKRKKIQKLMGFIPCVINTQFNVEKGLILISYDEELCSSHELRECIPFSEYSLNS